MKIDFTKRQYFDGAMGTMLQQRGLPAGYAPEKWNIENPDAIYSVHRAYVDAGCTILKTNTFGAHPMKQGGEEATKRYVSAGVAIARKAADAGCGVAVALDIGPVGKLLKPLGDLDFEDAVAQFRAIAAAGATAGADCVLIETMSDLYECKAAVLGVREVCDLPICVTLTFNEKGLLMTGADPITAVVTLEALGVTAVGCNCGLGPEQLIPVMEQMAKVSHIPLIANPNAGLPRVVDGKTTFPLDADSFAAEMALLAPYATHLGGCCGTSPAHIGALIRAAHPDANIGFSDDAQTYISSGSRSLALGKMPILIGERLNPTGKAKLKNALKSGDMAYIQSEALSQADAGAHALDVNAGLPGIDEAKVLCDAVCAVQEVCSLPLQIDTGNPHAMEASLRRYNGKALINSVNGKPEVMDAIFPLVKKYGGTVIALTLDDAGIPETAEGRFAIAKRIVERAADYGIPKREIIVDPLTLTVSTNSESALVTLESIRLIRERLGIGTSLGVSNISFGLPMREHINAAFFTMALQAGLSAAICNPGSAAMQAAYRSYLALSGQDPQCMSYVQAYAEEEASKPKKSSKSLPSTDAAAKAEVPTKTSAGLYQFVVKGQRQSAASAVKELLTVKTPMEIVDSELIPALNEVGRGFESGKLFLPNLLMSAEAAKAAFQVIREHLSEEGSEQESRGTIVMATVKGDIHDIGKNIVCSILENYRFRVIDLGKDVAPETILEAVRTNEVRLVGLSALMTTTVGAMKETIDLLHREVPECKIVVGGAVLTQSYADEIGADFYAADAMATVHHAETLFA